MRTRRAPFSWRTSVGSGCGVQAGTKESYQAGAAAAPRRSGEVEADFVRLEVLAHVIADGEAGDVGTGGGGAGEGERVRELGGSARGHGRPLAQRLQAHAAEGGETLPVRSDRLEVLGQVHLVGVTIGLDREPRHADLDVDADPVPRLLLLHVEGLDLQAAAPSASGAPLR